MEFLEIARLIALILAILTFFKGIIEYMKQGSLKRAEQFILMRKKLKENETFRDICTLLEDDDEKLSKIPYGDKRDFLGYFEELALMMNSKIIKKEVVHYMFGYYAIKCWESKKFWICKENGETFEIAREGYYWSLFKHFAIKMEHIQNKFKLKNFKF